MKSYVLFLAAMAMPATMTAENTLDNDSVKTKSIHVQDCAECNDCVDEPIPEAKTTYLTDAFGGATWSNWFLSVRGGVSVFSGMPVGHSDFFGREQPMLNVALGKWFSPYFGGRLAFQGFELIDADSKNRKYQNFHMDFLYNVAAHFRTDRVYLPRWTFAPYIGTGLIHNNHTEAKLFALSYGVIIQYRAAKRVNIGVELANTMTWRDFDGQGDGSYLGDNLIQASAGLSVTLGRVGWTRVADARPFIEQLDLVNRKMAQLQRENEQLRDFANNHDEAVKDIRGILQDEGLTAQYEGMFKDQEAPKGCAEGPRNNYSGLNSLRARMRMNGQGNDTVPHINGQFYKDIASGKVTAAPIFFFFKKGTTNLTEPAQVINIKEVAKAIKEYGLGAEVIGAADSETGTPSLNEKLSERRADTIKGMLVKEGAPAEAIRTRHLGGIDNYAPLEGNRNSCILLKAREKEKE